MNELYRRVAEGLAPGELPFMNYGYAEPRASYDWIRPEDRRHKYHFSLARRVLSGVALCGKAVLEVGSGRGGNCDYLARYSDAASIRGVEACWENAAAAGRALGGRVQFAGGDAARLPFADQTFDVVLNIESSHCYEDLGAFLGEVRRVLRPGGVLAYADIWFLNTLPYDWQARLRELKGCGLRVEQEEDISEAVFAALKQDDGLSGTLRQLERDANRELFRQLRRGNEAIRLHLAAAHCRYRRWILRRP